MSRKQVLNEKTSGIDADITAFLIAVKSIRRAVFLAQVILQDLGRQTRLSARATNVRLFVHFLGSIVFAILGGALRTNGFMDSQSFLGSESVTAQLAQNSRSLRRFTSDIVEHVEMISDAVDGKVDEIAQVANQRDVDPNVVVVAEKMSTQLESHRTFRGPHDFKIAKGTL